MDKRTTEREVIAELRDGMTIGIGGWGSRRKPMSLVREILRSDLKDLTIGDRVTVLCHEKVENTGKWRYQGLIHEIQNDQLILNSVRKSDELNEIPFGKIEQIRYNWNKKKGSARTTVFLSATGIFIVGLVAVIVTIQNETTSDK